MFYSLLCIILAFYWLLTETDFLSVRFLTGKEQIEQPEPIADRPYYWQSSDKLEKCLTLCSGCNNSKLCNRDKENRWTGWKIPARSIRFYNSTLNSLNNATF